MLATTFDANAPMSVAVPEVTLGVLLREWRAARRLSQLDLALAADVSARHLSFVENGKSQPSRDMVVRLADALEMPLRERNALLMAAGFAPMFPETGLQTQGMEQVRRAIEFMLAQQEPYPAFLLNRHWDIVMANRAAMRFNRHVLGGRDSAHSNMMRACFDPADLRGAMANWEEVAGDLIRHLHNAVAGAPSDLKARALLNDVLAQPGVPAHWRRREPGSTAAPLLTVRFACQGQEPGFFSTLTTFGTPRDVTVDELHVESCFPIDDATAQLCRRLAAEDAGDV